MATANIVSGKENLTGSSMVGVNVGRSRSGFQPTFPVGDAVKGAGIPLGTVLPGSVYHRFTTQRDIVPEEGYNKDGTPNYGTGGKKSFAFQAGTDNDSAFAYARPRMPQAGSY